MQVAEVKSHSTAKNQIQAKRQPFFSKEGQNDFFSSSNDSNSSFFNSPNIQPKLTIGQPNDKYEVEADAIADKVVRKLNTDTGPKSGNGLNGGSVQRKCSECEQEEKLQKKENEIGEVQKSLQRKPIFESNAETPESEIQKKPISTPPIQLKCSSCEEKEKLQKKEDEEQEDTLNDIQARSEDTVMESSTPLESQLNSTKGKGSPLPDGVASSMGSAFGKDFSNVRVHTGSEAVQMSKDIGAQAFTHGSDIYFNQGKYDTNSSSGKHLLAHELTHTVQQNNGLKRRIQKNPVPWRPIRDDEQDTRHNDRFRSQTYELLMPSEVGINDDPARTGEELGLTDGGPRHRPTRWHGRIAREISVFVPEGAGTNPEQNKVHLFFGANESIEHAYRSRDPRARLVGNNDINIHGLRGASNETEWILIGIPGLTGATRDGRSYERAGGYVSISQEVIRAILTDIGRDNNHIHGIRLSAHSRGYRGLQYSLLNGGFSNSMIEQVTIFDAAYRSVSRTLSSSGIPGSRVLAFQVVEDDEITLPGAHNVQLNASAMRAIGYTRLILDAWGRPNERWLIPQQIENELLELPPRGSFTTNRPPQRGQINIHDYITQHRRQIIRIDRNRDHRVHGLRHFVNRHNLPSFGNVYSPGIEAHHYFVAEFGHMAVENLRDTSAVQPKLKSGHLFAHRPTKTIQHNYLVQNKLIQRAPDVSRDYHLGIDYKKAREKNRLFWRHGLRSYNPFNSINADPFTTPNKFAHATRWVQKYLVDAKFNDSLKKHGIKIRINGIFNENLHFALIIIATSGNLESFRNSINHLFELSYAIKRYRRLLTTNKTNNPELLSPFFSRYWQFNMMNLTKNIAFIKGKDAGPHVQALQDALIELNYTIPEDKANGNFNKETEEALKQFQINSGFTGKQVDGKLGQATLKELDLRFANKNKRKIRSGGGQPAFSFDIPIHDYMEEDLFLNITIMHVFKVSEAEARRLTKDPPKLHFEDYKNITPSDIAVGHKRITIKRSLYEEIVGKVKTTTGRSVEDSSKEEAKAQLFKLQETRELYKINLQIKEIEKALRLSDFSTYLRLFPIGTASVPGMNILADRLRKKLPGLKAQRDAELKRLNLDLNIFETDVEIFKKAFGKYAFQSAHDMLRENEMRARMELIRYSDINVSKRVQKITAQLAPLYKSAKKLWWQGVSQHVLGTPDIITDEASLVLALAGKNLLEGIFLNISAPQIMQLYQIYNQKDKPLNDFFKRSFEKEFAAFAILKPATKEYPILAFPGLNLKEESGKYAGMDPEKFRKHLVSIISGKDGILKSIKNTRGRLNANYMLVWELPPIIARAKRDLKIPDESVHADIIKDEVKRIEDANFWRDIGLAALGIALGIAAIASGPIGWAALAGAVVVGGVDAYIQYQDISFKRDAADTAMDPTKALSNVKPSWFWFAVSIAGLGLDMGVGKIISGTAKLTRGVVRGSRLAEITKDSLKARQVLLEKALKQGQKVDEVGDIATQISQIKKVLAKTNWRTFAKHSDILIKVKDNPDIVMRLAKALKLEPIEEAIFSLQAMKLGPGNFENILKFYGSVGNDFISELPEVMHFIKVGELGTHPRLISEIITQPRTQQVFLDNIHDPKLLLKHWDEYLEAIKTSKGLRFYEYLEQLGFATKLRKPAKLTDEFGAAFAKLPQLTRNRKILQLTEAKFLEAFNNGKLPAKAQEALEALLKEDLIGKTADLNRATKRIMERVAPLLGDSLENVKDFRRIINLINTPSARKLVLESATSLKGQGEFSRLLALPHNARRLKANPAIMDDLIKLGPLTDDKTIDWLIKSKEIREAFVKNPGAMKALKKCASPCFPLNATPDDIRDIQALIAANKMSPVDYAKLNEYFYLNRKANKFRSAMEALKEPGKFKEVIGNVQLLKAKDVVPPAHWVDDITKGTLTVKDFRKKVANLVGKGMSPTQLQTIIQQAGIYKVNGKEFMEQLSRALNFTNKQRMDSLGALFNGLASTKKSRFDIAYEMLRNIGDHGKKGVTKTDAILSKFKIDDLAYFKELAGDGLTLNALHKVSTKINGSREEIINLINHAGAKAKGGNLDPDILRLARLVDELGGGGKHSLTAIEEAILQANKLADALKAAGNKIGDEIWGFPKTGSGKRKLPKKFKKPDGSVSGSEAIMHVKSRANEIAETVIKADGTIDYTQWHIIKQAIEEVDMDQILKNKIIGEVLWPKVNALKIGKGPGVKKIVEEVSIRIKGSDPEIKAIIDAVIVKEDGSVVFKEFKVGSAKLSENQELVYKLMAEGKTDLLEPFGAKAKMVWDDISKEFKADKVDIIRDKEAAKKVASE